MLQFRKYELQEKKQKIMLIYLLLNKCEVDKIEKIIECKEDNKGATFVKMYGLTSEFIDTDKIYKEINDIKVPNICNVDGYELYTNSKEIYLYTAKEKTRPLYINDMNILSDLMIIKKDSIVSKIKAEPLEKTNSKGFMYFVDYILKNQCEIGKWRVKFKEDEKIFEVFYISKKSEDTEKKKEEIIYQSKNWDKYNTFKLVLYIINKNIEYEEEFVADNYKIETLKLKK